MHNSNGNGGKPKTLIVPRARSIVVVTRGRLAAILADSRKRLSDDDMHDMLELLDDSLGEIELVMSFLTDMTTAQALELARKRQQQEINVRTHRRGLDS